MAKRGRKKKKQHVNINVVVAIMIIASILLAVLIYSNSGFIGEHLSPFLGGIMGYVKYFLPIGVFILAIYIAYQGETSWSKKIVQFCALLLCISVIMNVYEIYQGNIILEGKSLENIINQFFNLGSKGAGGGAIGAIFTIPLIDLFEKVGTIIIASGGIIALTVSMFGIDLVNRISDFIDGAEERKETKKDKNVKKDENSDDEKIIGIDNKKETKRERKLREKQEQEKEALDVEQLQINVNGKELGKSKLFDVEKEIGSDKKSRKERKDEVKQSP